MTALALITALVLWPVHHGETSTKSYRQPVWRLIIRKDRFTGDVTCRLFQGPRDRARITFARQALAFRFAHTQNTLRAAYQVDQSPVQPWTTVYPTLVTQGANLPAASLTNPTGGLVILPLSAVTGGHVVTIRPTPKSRPSAFDIDGLGDALARGKLLGCASPADFIW